MRRARTHAGALGAILCLLPATACRSGQDSSAGTSRAGRAEGKTVVLAIVPEGARPPPLPGGSVTGIHPMGVANALTFTFGQRGGVAWVAASGEKVQVFHNGRAGKPYSAVTAMTLSPDGQRCAFGGLEGGRWRMVVDGVEGRGFDTVRSPVFSSDGKHVAYEAMAGERWHLVVDQVVGAGTRTRYLTHAFDAGSRRLVHVEVEDGSGSGTGRLVATDLYSRKETLIARGVAAIHLNEARTRLAAVIARGGKRSLLLADLGTLEVIEKGGEFDAIRDVAFGSDGLGVAYAGERDGVVYVAAGARDAPVAAGELAGAPVRRPGSVAVGALVATAGTFSMRELFVPEGPREGIYEEAEGLVYSRDGRSHAYAARRGGAWCVVVNGREGPPLDRVVSPVFTPDGTRVVYRARRDGWRFVVVAGLDGSTLWEDAPHEEVHPVTFSEDGLSLAYGVRDGPRLAWTVDPL